MVMLFVINMIFLRMYNKLLLQRQLMMDKWQTSLYEFKRIDYYNLGADGALQAIPMRNVFNDDEEPHTFTLTVNFTNDMDMTGFGNSRVIALYPEPDWVIPPVSGRTWWSQVSVGADHQVHCWMRSPEFNLAVNSSGEPYYITYNTMANGTVVPSTSTPTVTSSLYRTPPIQNSITYTDGTAYTILRTSNTIGTRKLINIRSAINGTSVSPGKCIVIASNGGNMKITSIVAKRELESFHHDGDYEQETITLYPYQSMNDPTEYVFMTEDQTNPFYVTTYELSS